MNCFTYIPLFFLLGWTIVLSVGLTCEILEDIKYTRARRKELILNIQERELKKNK